MVLINIADNDANSMPVDFFPQIGFLKDGLQSLLTFIRVLSPDKAVHNESGILLAKGRAVHNGR